MTPKTSVIGRALEALAMSNVEAARLPGIRLRTVDRLITLKDVPVRRLGRRILIPRTSMQTLLRADRPIAVT